MKGWAVSVAEISVFSTEISATGLKISPHKHPSWQPGRNVFDKIASLSQQSGQNDIFSLCMLFLFGSMRINFVTKVTGVNKTSTVANDTTFLRQFLFVSRILSQSTGLKCLK